MDTVPGLLHVGLGAAPAIVSPGGPEWPFATVASATHRMAGQLRALGIRRQDAVAILLPNGPEMAASFLAVATAAAAAPINPRLTPAEITAALSILDVRAVIVGPGSDLAVPSAVPHLEIVASQQGWVLQRDGAALPAGEPGQPAPGDTALLLQTSGTTARPKTVPLTHANLAAGAANVARWFALGPSDRSLAVMPLFHIHGIVASLLAPLSAGGSVATPPPFDAFAFADWLEASRPTYYSAVPTIHQLILQRAKRQVLRGSGRLRFVRSSSSALPPAVMEGLETAFGVPAIECYGMTEASHQMAANPLPPEARKPGSVGLPAGADVMISRSGSVSAAPGEAGEVLVRGPGLTPGYLDNPGANRDSFVDGWFRTGDQGYLDADGYLFLTGRLKELINRGGEKIAPRELEEALLGHPAIVQAAVFALSHPTLGEDVGCAVVVLPGETIVESEVRAFLSDKLAPFKCPRRVLVVEQLPLGPTGKVQRIGMARRLGLE
jgi:acyl-CoA synthetase (AMP-forming)/AMP-acid ligase II